MAFSFGFSGDDIEGDSDSENLAKQLNKANINSGPSSAQLSPQRFTLAQLLESIPSQLSYNYLDISNVTQDDRNTQQMKIPRRSLFDIRQQLMAESDPMSSSDGNLLSGLETGDLSSGIYEGGFKTWECSLDLAGLVLGMKASQPNQPLHLIELGAGSAIPSLVTLQKRLKTCKATDAMPLRLTLCDYNEEVLRLCTAANVLLTTCLSQDNTKEGEVEVDAELEDIDQPLVESCLSRLEDTNISIDLISGAWGDAFIDLIEPPRKSEQTLILASETIYSPASIEIFSKVLLDLLNRDPGRCKAWVAAKKVYFGVGGGVQEFKDETIRLGGKCETIFDEKGAGVGRVVIEVTVQR